MAAGRFVHPRLARPAEELDPADRATIDAALARIDAFFLDRDDEALRRWSDQRDSLGREWQDASMLGTGRCSRRPPR